MNRILSISFLNWVFIVQLALFSLIITGALPREVSVLLAVGLAGYFLFASIEDATVLFVRSIPFFIAIPITTDFDNFNTWRILSAILFLKLIWPGFIKFKFSSLSEFSITRYLKELTAPSKLLLLLLLLAFLSVIPAVDRISAITRIIYFVNLSLVGIVVYQLTINNESLVKRLVKNITVPTIIVTVVGFIQLASTYFIDIYQFMRIWGEGIQMRQFGVLWSEIAVKLGNTWFAYYGEQLSLRVFSLFPDSHSFPQFVLLGLPALFAVALLKVTSYQLPVTSLKEMVRTRASLNIVWVALAMLITILSGTRGIWAASAGVLIIAGCVIYWLHRTGVDGFYGRVFKYMSLYMAVFYLLFAVAYPIFVSPQFLLSKGDWGLFGERIKSIIDFGETSNSQRIEIWKASIESIKEKPLLGVGIGNFPVVLDQRIFLARAGSSAHNIYLHIASEMGVIALSAAILFLWLLFKKSYDNFVSEHDPLLIVYWAGTILFVPWVLIYSLTDVALFDERTFLLFVTTLALILVKPRT